MAKVKITAVPDEGGDIAKRATVRWQDYESADDGGKYDSEAVEEWVCHNLTLIGAERELTVSEALELGKVWALLSISQRLGRIDSSLDDISTRIQEQL